MKKHWRGIVTAMCGVACVCTVLFGVVPFVKTIPNNYSAQEVFYSEEAYETFKADIKNRIATSDLQVNTFDVIASEPPIIVNWSITTPYDYMLPYGETNTHSRDWLTVTTLSLIAGALFVFLPHFILYP